MISRNEISRRHPVITFGGTYRLLKDGEKLRHGDETALVCMLLRPEGDKWVTVDGEDGWDGDIAAGKTVGEILGPDSPDADAFDRLFRRKV